MNTFENIIGDKGRYYGVKSYRNRATMDDIHLSNHAPTSLNLSSDCSRIFALFVFDVVIRFVHILSCQPRVTVTSCLLGL